MNTAFEPGVSRCALDANGDPYPGYSGWMALTEEEVKLHFVRGTEVATGSKD